MRLLAVHPSSLMYTKVFLRLEPLGLELVAGAARNKGHEVEIIDLQVEKHPDYWERIERFRPHAICFSGNYLANVPEIIDLCKETRKRLPTCSCSWAGIPSRSSRATCWPCPKGR